jgi:hypothetical protein
VHGLEEKEGAEAFFPCSEATAEKMDGGDGAMAEFGGDGELGRRSGGEGQELREATKMKTWCKGGSLSVRCTTREKMRGREGVPHWRRASPAAAENRGGGVGGFGARARERESVRERKGRNEGDAWVLYGQREGRGSGRGWRLAALP